MAVAQGTFEQLTTGGLAEVDPDNPNMWSRCDRCGFVTNHSKMVWQYDFRGTPPL